MGFKLQKYKNNLILAKKYEAKTDNIESNCLKEKLLCTGAFRSIDYCDNNRTAYR